MFPNKRLCLLIILLVISKLCYIILMDVNFYIPDKL